MASRAKLSSHCSALSSDIMAGDKMHYSEKYYDDVYEYRHAISFLPRFLTIDCSAAWRADCSRYSEIELHANLCLGFIVVFRHVELSEEMADRLPPNRLLAEPEWRALERKQSCRWDNYLIYEPEPHIFPSHRPHTDVSTRAENAPSDSTPIDK
ncbi:unnamed protein product [Taenia asiatica]|uniref:Cyclin-dependent kinases regulatory subunit n=1 Tax=Taenia asiatica TaxID=60517 RepID=A0A0R3VXX3_TAEAS|nr:unnamed protein product [Taenia asiatica]